MRLTAIVECCKETGLYVGYVPGFPGAHSQGETLDELNKHLSHLQNSNSTSRAKLMAFDSWQFLALIRCWAACGASPR